MVTKELRGETAGTCKLTSKFHYAFVANPDYLPRETVRRLRWILRKSRCAFHHAGVPSSL